MSDSLRILVLPREVVPDLTTRGGLLRYARLRAHGFNSKQAEVLSDRCYDSLPLAVIPGLNR